MAVATSMILLRTRMISTNGLLWPNRWFASPKRRMLTLIEQYIDDDEFTNRSEFQRFAVEFLLVQFEGEDEPTTAEFDEIKVDILKTTDFLQTASFVRQYAVRTMSKPPTS